MREAMHASNEAGDAVEALTPEQFWRAFQSAASSRTVAGGRPFGISWRTKQVLERKLGSGDGRQQPGLMESIAQQLHLDYVREFYGYDAVFHRGKVSYGGQAIRGRRTAPGEISVALEHENDPETSQHELYKLSLLAVPLKVLVTYPLDYGHVSELLESYISVLKLPPVNWIGTLLIIFGLPSQYPAFASWLAYVYDSDEISFNLLGDLSP